MQFKIKGSERDSGKDVEFTLEAENYKVAESMALGRGVVVASVKPVVARPAAPVRPLAAPMAAPTGPRPAPVAVSGPVSAPRPAPAKVVRPPVAPVRKPAAPMPTRVVGGAPKAAPMTGGSRVGGGVARVGKAGDSGGGSVFGGSSDSRGGVSVGAGESRAGESRAGESRAGQSRAGESRAGESRLGGEVVSGGGVKEADPFFDVGPGMMEGREFEKGTGGAGTLLQTSPAELQGWEAALGTGDAAVEEVKGKSGVGVKAGGFGAAEVAEGASAGAGVAVAEEGPVITAVVKEKKSRLMERVRVAVGWLAGVRGRTWALTGGGTGVAALVVAGWMLWPHFFGSGSLKKLELDVPGDGRVVSFYDFEKDADLLKKISTTGDSREVVGDLDFTDLAFGPTDVRWMLNVDRGRAGGQKASFSVLLKLKSSADVSNLMKGQISNHSTPEGMDVYSYSRFYATDLGSGVLCLADSMQNLKDEVDRYKGTTKDGGLAADGLAASNALTGMDSVTVWTDGVAAANLGNRMVEGSGKALAMGISQTGKDAMVGYAVVLGSEDDAKARVEAMQANLTKLEAGTDKNGAAVRTYLKGAEVTQVGAVAKITVSVATDDVPTDLMAPFMRMNAVPRVAPGAGQGGGGPTVGAQNGGGQNGGGQVGGGQNGGGQNGGGQDVTAPPVVEAPGVPSAVVPPVHADHSRTRNRPATESVGP